MRNDENSQKKESEPSSALQNNSASQQILINPDRDMHQSRNH